MKEATYAYMSYDTFLIMNNRDFASLIFVIENIGHYSNKTKHFNDLKLLLIIFIYFDVIKNYKFISIFVEDLRVSL